MVPRINTRIDRVLQAMVPNTITPAVEAVCRCKANVRLRHLPQDIHTRRQLSSLLRLNLDPLSLSRARRLRRPGFIHLQSSFLVRNTRSNRGVDGWASRPTHVMGTAIPNVL
ncbi:hypothetical protein TNCV_5122131 [Trichonephila clavipes]|nr:hypothetical protein TNCV_5122131 [Trichonephila clavipes]